MVREVGRGKKWIVGVVALVGTIAFVTWIFLSRREIPRQHAAAAMTIRRSSGSLAKLGPDQRALTSKIVGSVRTADGKPAQALVYVLALDRVESGAPEREISPRATDSAGRFEFSSLLPGSYAVTATSAGVAPAHQAPVDVQLGAPSEVELVLGSGGLILSGTVLDADGGPVPEAMLAADWKRFELVTDGFRRVFQFKSDGSGRFTAHLQPGHYRVSVSADGYAAAEYWIDLTASLQRNFILQRAGSIAGRIVQGPAAEPVADAVVELMITGAYRTRPGGGDARAPAKAAELTADAQGAFRFTAVSAGSYLVMARKGKLVGQRTEVVTVEPGSAVENADVTLSEGLFVQGRVVSGSFVPIAGAGVSVTAGGFNPHFVQATMTGADGTFSIEGLLPGPYRLDARAQGYGSFVKEFSLRASSPGHEIVLPADTGVQGVLLAADGQAVPNALVTLWNSSDKDPTNKGRITRTLVTNGGGRFVFAELTPGYFWLEAADGKGVAGVGPESLLTGETRRVELRFGEGAGISGAVKWKGGGPAADVLVRCKGTLLDRSARTDAGGNYRCDGLIADTYVVAAVNNLADEPWYFGTRGSPVEVYGGKTVELAAGKREQGVNLELDRDEHSVSGVVVEPDGTPAANVAVRASREGFGVSYLAMNSRAIDGRSVTSNDGTFRIDNLPEGPYTLSAQSMDGEGRQRNVPSGGKVRIELQRTGVVRGVVVDGDGRPVTSFTIAVYLGGSGSGLAYDDAVVRVEGPAVAVQPVFGAAGRFEVAGLRQGTYDFVAVTTDGRSGRAAAVLSNEEHQQNVRIQIKDADALSGHVVDYDTGAPVAGCKILAIFSEREVEIATSPDGSFKVPGPAVGQAVRLRLGAAGYFDDFHTAIMTGSAGGDIGTIKLIRGRWSDARPRYLDWELEGRVDNTVVVAVRPGSQVEKAGVLPGAVVVKVGANDASQLGPLSVSYLIARLGTAPSVVLRLPNGELRPFAF
jgi:protocatechuate 3,4-dioxygenase beta subunit